MTTDSDSSALQLNDVSFAYTDANGKPLPILNDLCFSVSTGSSTAIMGPSGSGKTTLLNLMAMLDRPTSGTLSIAGENALVDDARRTALRCEHIGMIFQQHHLLPQCTALENVLLPVLASGKKKPDPSDTDRARALLTEIGLGERLHHFPAKLSGGERQRVAIARALINRPSVLLADEPTGSLDEQRTRDIMELLLSLVRDDGTALVVVTHSLEVARYCRDHYRLTTGSLLRESLD